MRTLTVVIPALNEAENLAAVTASIPRERLAALGWETEVIVVDNGSTDGTGAVAAGLGCTVVPQPDRGYGNAYRAGFDAAKGEVIATGDADRTYPFDHLPELLARLDASGADFMTTDRLHAANRGAMKGSHYFANHVLSFVSRLLFRHSIRDSQSGMWIFRSYVWADVDVRSPGMAFSQEIKNAAVRAGFKVAETHIEYRVRGGQVKLNSVRDGVRNLTHLVEHRFRRDVSAAGDRGARESAGRFPAQHVQLPGMRSPSSSEAEGAAAECQPDTNKAV